MGTAEAGKALVLEWNHHRLIGMDKEAKLLPPSPSPSPSPSSDQVVVHDCTMREGGREGGEEGKREKEGKEGEREERKSCRSRRA